MGKDAAANRTVQRYGLVFLRREKFIKAHEENEVVICSTTAKGFETAPGQIAFPILPTCARNGLVSVALNLSLSLAE